MRILILSDSHHGMNFMEECAFRLKPDCILHLGDYYADGFDLKQEFPKQNSIRCREIATLTAARRTSP